MRAIEHGVSKQKIARALNVNVDQIKRRRRMLKGICPQAVHLLSDKSVNPATFDILQKMKTSRQIEACGLMVASSKFSSSQAKALAATKDEDRVKPARPLCPAVVTLADLSLMERELKQVQRALNGVKASYGRDMLHLTIAAGTCRVSWIAERSLAI